MRKLYLTYNEKDKKQESYSYSGETNPVYTNLSSEETEAYLRTILKEKIESTRCVNDNLLEVVTKSGEIVVIDSLKIFKESSIANSNYIELQNRIKASLENNNLRVYKSKLPEGYNPRVNRTKNEKDKYIIEDNSIGTNLILSSGYTELSMDLSNIEMYNNETARGR